MHKTHYKLIVCLMVFFCLIILPTSFAADADSGLMDEGLISDNPLELADSVDGDDSLHSLDIYDEMLESSESNDFIGANDYYFDSNQDEDGNGTKGNPYNFINSTRIKDNSIIHLANGVYELKLSPSNTYKNVTIIGKDATQTIIKGFYRSFDVKENFILQNLTFESLTVYNRGKLNATNVIFCNGIGYSNYGGAIYSSSKDYSVYLNNCTFLNNSAKYGGAIFLDHSKIELKNCKFLNNSATIIGGAIYLMHASFKGSNLTASDCRSKLGGAFLLINSSAQITNLYGANNTANYEGGVIYQMYGNLTVSNSTFILNNARNGAGIFADGIKRLSIYNDTFINNSAIEYAGAIYSIFNNDTYINNIIYDNNAAMDYDDLYNTSRIDLIIGNNDYEMYVYNLTDGDIPSYYSSLTEGYVTPVKNQGNGGNCWAFATIATLESCILKASGDNLDLSEENMKNIAELYSIYGWNMETNGGGYDDMALGYLLSWLGPVNDSDDTYDHKSLLSPVLSSIMHVQNVLYLKRDNFTDNDMIKRAIMDYGAVFTPIYLQNSLLIKDSSIGYYKIYDNETSCNHAVVLVGWDDEIKVPGAPGKGAWIAKNSWGTTSTNDGYFYLSYYDKSSPPIGENDATFTFILNDTIKFDKNYQYDIAKTDYLYNTTNTVWYKNIFNATDNEYLTAVSTYFEKETNWDLSVYVNNVKKVAQSGFSNPGYWTINLNEPIALNVGDIFEIVFKIKVKGDAGVPVSESVSLNNVFYKENISFISYNGKNWTDLFDFVWNGYPAHTYKSQVACIKAFTVLEKINTTVSLDVNCIEAGGNSFNPVNITVNVLNQYGYPVNYGKVKFNLSDDIVYADVSNGVAKISHIFNKGFNTIFAEFVSTAYNSPLVSSTVDITKYDLFMEADISLFLDTAFVNITLNETVNETISFILGYKNFTAQSIDGKASINLTDLNVGLNNLKIVLYPALYDCNELYYDFTVDVNTTNVLVSDFETVYGNAYEYKIKLVNQDGSPLSGKKLEYSLNDLKYTGTTDDNGEITLTKIKAGTYDLNVCFKGEKLYSSSSNSSKIIIKTTIVLPDYSNYTYGSKYSVKFLDKDLNPLKNANVTITFGGKVYNLKTDSNGKVNINNNLKPGTYTVKVKNPNTSEEKTHTIKVLARINQNKNLTMYFGASSNYKVRVFDDYGRIAKNVSVKFTFNGKTYNRRTDSKGYAYLKISGLKPKSYTISASYKGFTVKNKVTVKSTIVTKNISVKKANTIKFTAKLLNSKGAILKSKYIVFKFKSKKYKVKTNSKGIATLSLKNLNKGKYTVYSTYGKLTVKNTITIK